MENASVFSSSRETAALAAVAVVIAWVLWRVVSQRRDSRCYASRSYWDRRYRRTTITTTTNATHDWYHDPKHAFGSIEDALRRRIRKGRFVEVVNNGGGSQRLFKLRVLDLGCGNSLLGEHLAALENERGGMVCSVVECVDFSSEAVYQMRRMFPARARRYHAMDARKTSFPDGSFDAVIDKGLVDALMHGGDNGKKGTGDAHAVMAEVARLLAPGGILVSVSCRGEDKWRDDSIFRGIPLRLAGTKTQTVDQGHQAILVHTHTFEKTSE